MKKFLRSLVDSKLKIGILVVVLLAIIGYGISDSPEFLLKVKSIDLEYGEELEDLNNYIKTTNIDKSKVEYSCDTIDDDMRQPTVGKHIITYEYRGVTRELEVNVKDTTPPKVTKLSDVSIIENDHVKYEDYFKVEELSGYNVNVDDSTVNYAVPGAYNANIKITDKYKNVSEITIPVVVNQLELETTISSLDLEPNQNNKINIKTNSSETIKYSSSNEAVAIVDNNGNIKTLKAGKAIISASVNGKSVTCNVTVKDKEVPKVVNNYHSNDNVSYTVYVTKTGDCYHSGDCGYLSRSKIAIEKSSALLQGYRACSRCNP